MRIVAGNFKGSTLLMPRDKNTRPLKDLTRESIFNLLTHSNKVLLQLKESNVLDLYAGTGSFGLECLSRQAKSICFVEKGLDVAEILEKNIKKLRVKKKIKVFINDTCCDHPSVKVTLYNADALLIGAWAYSNCSYEPYSKEEK